MSMMAPSTDRWAVSCRVHGEVSTVEAHAPGLAIHLIGLPDGFSRDEVEGWIASLATASREGAVAASPHDPIPPVLRHVLGGLLFSHAELWGHSAGGPVSVVLVNEDGRIGFGWVGEATARIYEDGRELAPEWVSVRDHQGRESRAWCGDARRDLRIELACAPESESGRTRVDLEAHWTALTSEPLTATPDLPSAAPADVSSLEPATPAQLTAEAGGEIPTDTLGRPGESAPEAPDHEADERERPSSGVARWLSRAFGWEKNPNESATAPGAPDLPAPGGVVAGEGAVSADIAGEGSLESAPAYSEPASGDQPLAAEAVPAAGDARATLDPEDESLTTLDLSHAQPLGDALDLRGVPVDIPLPPGVPDEIPPTPEPSSLTERALRGAFALDDPRAISLPDRSGASPTRAAASAPPAPPKWKPPTREPEIRPVDLSATAAETGAEAQGEASAEAKADRGGHARAHAPRRPEWPEAPASTARPAPDLRRWGIGGLVVLLLFGAGWLVGSFQGGNGEQKPSPLVGFLRKIGIAGARFETLVTTRPAGAAIVVDGKDTGLRSPATLEMSPGEHRVDLSFADLGSASFMVKGAKGDKVPLDAGLWGGVDVTVSDPSSPISVAVDGEARGFAPMTVDSLAPGPHELRFTGPGMASWGTTIEVRVGETREVLAYPLQSPATGLLQVRAVLNQDGESQPLSGARVYVDGDLRGQTPLTLELPRGPHSVRVTHQQESGPVQVIDLPGGNQRFATFEFGLNLEYPTLTLRAPATIPSDEPVLISATLGQVAAADVTEMWLHVLTPDRRWRRYPMTLIEAQGSAVGAAPFPAVLLGPDGTTLYYVSALTSQGDEHFSEIQKVSAARNRPAR